MDTPYLKPWIEFLHASLRLAANLAGNYKEYICTSVCFAKLMPKIPLALPQVQGCVCDIFASLICMSKREHFRNKEKYFLFHFKSPFHSCDNQTMKHKTHFPE